MAHIAGHPQIGADPVDDGTDDPQTFKYDLYSLRRNTPDLGGRKLQDVYGRTTTLDGVTTVMPSYQWLETIKTGERTYTDTSAEDRALLAKAKADYEAAGGASSGLEDPMDIIKAELAPVIGQVAEGIGSSLATDGTVYEGLPFTTSGLKIAEGTTRLGDISKLNISPEDAGALGKLTQTGELATSDAIDVLGSEEAITKAGGVVGRDLSGGGVLGDGDFFDNLNPFGESGAGAQNFRSAAGGAVANFGVQLLLGQDPVKAAKSAGAGAIGKMLGTAIGGPIGGFIGGALGSIIGGRVICNELMRQGLLTRKEVILDYRFTRDYLTPTHVNGYHVWAVWMVKQMRKGKFVKFWKHVAGHRANEIAYIYGERDKPDYLGKVYRKILEPTCWVVGSFCKVTDWSVLYKQKEI
jgi:hypothetical protein